MTFNGFFPIFLTFGAIQGLVLALLFSFRAKDKRSGRLLAFFLVSYALPTLNFALLNSSVSALLPPRVILQPFTLLFGPGFYFFIKAAHRENEKIRNYFFHAIPFLLCCLYELGLIGGLLTFQFDYHATSVISALFYSFLAIAYYRKRSKISLVRFEYVQVMIYCYCVYVLFSLSFMALVLLGVGNRLPYIYSFGTAMTLLVYSMGFIAYWKSTSPPKRLDNDLGSKTIQKIRSGLDQLVEQKFYLHPNSQLQHVADILDTSPRYISRFINDEKGMSFPNFVNKLRVDEARHIIEKSADNPKMLAVALDSGFTNKVSFNKHFKKHTGLTPKQYKDQC